jgi:hypothetical protein
MSHQQQRLSEIFIKSVKQHLLRTIKTQQNLDKFPKVVIFPKAFVLYSGQNTTQTKTQEGH